MDKLKVIAISGTGRTGSTLLSLLLTQDASVFNLGQMRHLSRAYADDAPCSCGNALASCPVYGRVKPVGDLGRDLESIAAVTAARAFVDTSKTPETAARFAELPNVDLHVLNLVRDPRAVACSWYLRKRSVTGAIRNARDWKKRQLRLERWRESLGNRFLVVRYEDLATNPQSVVEAIAAWSNISIPDGLFTGPGRVRIDWGNQHLFPPANESVLAKRETDVHIAPAEGWKQPPNRWIHGLARFCAGEPGRRLYPDLSS